MIFFLWYGTSAKLGPGFSGDIAGIRGIDPAGSQYKLNALFLEMQGLSGLHLPDKI
jgi:hypothetical protein